MKRCVVALLVGLVLSLGGIALAVAPRGGSAGQAPVSGPPADRSTTPAGGDAGVAAGSAGTHSTAGTSAGDVAAVTDRRSHKRRVTSDRRAVTNPTGSRSGERKDRPDGRWRGRDQGTWIDAPPADPVWCTNGVRSIVVDRAWQRAWLCDAGAIRAVIPITSARSQPDPRGYEVYAKDWDTFSDYGPRRSTLDRFVAFAIGEEEGARVGFHAIPRYEDDGALAQPRSSVGSLRRKGDSSGCIRLLPAHADLLWNFLEVGDSVVVIS